MAGAERVTPHQFARQLARAFGIAADFPAASPGEKGDRRLLCEAPGGPLRQKVPVPLSPAGPLDETSLDTARARQWLGRPMPMLREGLDRLVQQARNGYRSRLRACGAVIVRGRAA